MPRDGAPHTEPAHGTGYVDPARSILCLCFRLSTSSRTSSSGSFYWRTLNQRPTVHPLVRDCGARTKLGIRVVRRRCPQRNAGLRCRRQMPPVVHPARWTRAGKSRAVIFVRFEVPVRTGGTAVSGRRGSDIGARTSVAVLRRRWNHPNWLGLSGRPAERFSGIATRRIQREYAERDRLDRAAQPS
jgi:hypothetical protein